MSIYFMKSLSYFTTKYSGTSWEGGIYKNEEFYKTNPLFNADPKVDIS
jgi:hypothetical protein